MFDQNKAVEALLLPKRQAQSGTVCLRRVATAGQSAVSPTNCPCLIDQRGGGSHRKNRGPDPPLLFAAFGFVRHVDEGTSARKQPPEPPLAQMKYSLAALSSALLLGAVDSAKLVLLGRQDVGKKDQQQNLTFSQNTDATRVPPPLLFTLFPSRSCLVVLVSC